MTVGIVTCEKCRQLTPGEQSLIPLLAAKGITATACVWNDAAVNWTSFDFLLVRSIWDYHLHPEEFQAWLTLLTEKKINTWNPVSILKQNHHKFYLQDLQRKGIRTVPTFFIPRSPQVDLRDVLTQGWRRAVIKPAISASSYMTRVFAPAERELVEKEFQSAVAERDFLVQEFMPSVQETGELSMIFFNRIFSHAVLKQPAPGEFRVQHEYGGHSTPIQPDSEIIHTAARILSCFDQPLLYARVDGLVVNGEFVLMEVELIEPDLFLDAHPEARTRFVNAILSLAPRL